MQTPLAEWLFLRTIQLTRMHLSPFRLLCSSIRNVKGVLRYFSITHRLQTLALLLQQNLINSKSHVNVSYSLLMNVSSP